MHERHNANKKTSISIRKAKKKNEKERRKKKPKRQEKVAKSELENLNELKFFEAKKKIRRKLHSNENLSFLDVFNIILPRESWNFCPVSLSPIVVFLCSAKFKYSIALF